MTHLNQTTLEYSNRILTCALLYRKHANVQMLFENFKVLLTVFVLLYGSSLHASSSAKYHEVKQGETIWRIAKNNNLKVEDIYAANGITSNTVIMPGQKIKLPVAFNEQQKVTQPQTIHNPNTGNNFKLHVVKPGENLFRIAKNNGVSQEQLMYANGMNNNFIRVGQSIQIPVSSRYRATQVYNNKNNAVAGFKSAIRTQHQLVAVQRAKGKFQVHKTGFNTYDIFENNKYQATIKDNVNSKYTKRRDGVFYNKGTKIGYNYIKSLGYDNATAHALSFVASNEGSASALNFYDGAGSFGFIQFTIKYGSFAKFVSLLKENDYLAYENYLVKYGIVLENNVLVVYAPEGYKGRTKLTGEMIIDYIIETKSLYGPLIELGENTKAAQVESAREQYMTPILKSQLNLKRLNRSVAISNLMNSSIGVTAVTDLAVKLGVSGATKEIESALDAYLASSASPYYSLKNISNYQLVQLIGKSSQNALVKRRMNKLLKQFSTNQLSYI